MVLFRSRSLVSVIAGSLANLSLFLYLCPAKLPRPLSLSLWRALFKLRNFQDFETDASCYRTNQESKKVLLADKMWRNSTPVGW